MIVDPVRKAHLSDLMVLTAATAAGVSLARYYAMTPWALCPTFDKRGVLFLARLYRKMDLRELATIGSFFLAAWSPALLCVRLLSPRPRLGVMLRGPGLLVSAVAIAFVFVFFAWNLAEVARQGWPNFAVPIMRGNQEIVAFLDLFPSGVLFRLRKSVGWAAVVALLTSVVIRSRRTKADWVDRSGLALGLAWGILYPA